MKRISIIFLTTLGITLALENTILPELLVYEVSEHDGEPQVKLVRTENSWKSYNLDDDDSKNYRVQENLFKNNNNLINQNRHRHNHISKRNKKNNYNLNYKDTQNFGGQSQNRDLYNSFYNNRIKKGSNNDVPLVLDSDINTILTQLVQSNHPRKEKVHNLNYRDTQNYRGQTRNKDLYNSFSDNRIKKGFNNDEQLASDSDLFTQLVQSNLARKGKSKKNNRQSEREALIQRLEALLRRLQEIDSEKESHLEDNMYVGTLTSDEAELFLNNLFKRNQKPEYSQYGSLLDRSQIAALRTFKDADLVDGRTDPPPPKSVYVPDYYD